MSQDLESKPSQGRFFPLSHSELVTSVNENAFTVHSYDKRLPVRLLNCDVECELGHQLCTFMRMTYLAALSLPEEAIALPLAQAAMRAAIGEFSRLDKAPHLSVNEQQFVVYRAYLAPLGRVIIAQHVVSGGNRSYLQYQRAAALSRAERSPARQVVLAQRAVA